LAGSYLKQLQLAKQLEEKTKEAAKNRSLAEKEHAAFEEFLKICKEVDVNLSEVEKPQQEFEAAMASKDYQSALGYAKKAMEAAKTAYVNRIGEVADSVDELLSLIQGSGGECKAAVDLLDRSRERVVADDFEGAMKLAKNAYDTAERSLHEEFSKVFSQAQEIIMEAKEMGDDVTVYDEQLARAKSSLENQEYAACMTQLTEALDGAGENLKTQVNEAISRTEELESAGEELGADISKVKLHAERARGSLEALKFKEALSYAKRAEGEGENAISARFQDLVRETRENIKKVKAAKEDVTVPQQLLDQALGAFKEKKYIESLHAITSAHEKAHQVQFQLVLEVISHARDRFVLAKKVGLDMTKAIALLNTSRDNLKIGKFEDAMSYAEQSRQEVDTALERFYKARDDLVELSKAVKFVGDLGADTASLRNLLTDARKHFEEKSYDKTVEATRQGLTDAKKLAKDITMEKINSSDKAVKFGRQIGADVTEAEGILQRSLEAMDKDEMLESVNLAESSREASNAAMTRLMSDKLQSIDQFIKGYSGGMALPDVSDLITRSRQNVAAYDFDEAYALLKQATQQIESVGQEECERVISLAKQKIDSARSMGGDPSDLEILLTRAGDALNRKVYEDATARAREVIEQADDMMTKLVQGEQSAMKDILEEARTIGIDIEETKIELMDARTKLDQRDFADAFNMVRRTKTGLQSRITRYDGIKAKIRRVEELISEAGRTKVDTAKFLKKLDAARNAFSSGDLDDAERLLDAAIADTEKSLAMYLAAKFILSSKENIDLAKANGIEVESSEKLLTRAKELMKEKSHEEALATAKKCDEETRNRLTTSISEMIRDLQRLLTDAKNVGVDTLGPEKLAERAAELAREGSYSESLKCISSAREDISHVKSLSSQAAVDIRAARTNLKDAETLDMDVGKARELLDQAVEALSRHQYAIALELARKSSETSSDVTKAQIWNTLGKFKERVEKASSEGLHVGMAERCVADGLQAFKEGKYQDSLKLAMKCESEMERAELQMDISTRAVEMARKKLQDASSDGTRTERVATLVARAEKLLKEGKYVDALSAAIASGDELHIIGENLDGLQVEIGGLRERLERLRNIDIDTSECEETLEMAQEFLAIHDFAKCRDAIKRAATMAAELFENSIEDVMRQNKLMISKAKAMGINTKTSEDLLEVANTSFAEKLWDFAYQQAMGCRDNCIDLISKKITSLADEVKGKMDTLRRNGATVSSVERLLDEARKAGSRGDVAGAFNMLMEADQKISLIEEYHKKYVDISIAAESALENLARFGIPKKEPERLLAMADIERENDYDSAIELVSEALDTAKELTESYSPEITTAISSPGMQQGAEGNLTVTLSNSGKVLAKDVSIRLEGDFEAREPASIPILRPGADESVEVKLKPNQSGSVPIKITVTSKRPLDGKVQTFEFEDALNVFGAGPAYKLARATDVTRCISCQGRIKPGFDILTCRCGGQLHLSCAKRTNQCPVCGQKYEF